MVSLRKLFLIPAALVALTGVASAASDQITCTAPAIVASVSRVEGRTEKLGKITFDCTPTTAVVGSVSYQIALTSPTALFTSPASGDFAPTITVAAAAQPATTTATVSPAQIIFSGVLLPTTPLSAATVTIDNIYIDASALPVLANPTVIVTAITGNLAVSDSNVFTVATVKVNSVAITTATTIAKSLTVYDTLTVGSSQGPTTFTACANETIDTTKVGGGTNGQVIDAITFAPLSVTSFTKGSRLVATFSNLPSGVQLYVPLIITGTDGTVASLVSGFNPATLAGGFVATAGTASTDKIAAVSNGVVLYEITTGGSAVITFDVTAIAKGPVLAASPVTLTAGYAPTSGTAVPRFVTGAAISSNFFKIAACQSTLFFPYVVAGSGYSTGIAISSSGDFGDASGAASGQCVVTYMGKGAPTATKTLDVTVGSTSAFVAASDVVPAASFFGYAVAKCNFLNATGYAYIANSTGGTASYLPMTENK